MKRDSTFKYVFWVVLVVVVLFFATVAYMFSHRADGPGEWGLNRADAGEWGLHPPGAERANMLVVLLPAVLLLAAYVVIVGQLVYKDAAKRGMDPWLWATVAAFVPNLIGVLIYLIVRQRYKNACLNCSKPIEKEFKVCPYCGHSQETACGNCQKSVAPDWQVCPYCAHPLKGKEEAGG